MTSKTLALANHLERTATIGLHIECSDELRRLYEENKVLRNSLYQMQQAAKDQYTRGLYDARDAITRQFSL